MRIAISDRSPLIYMLDGEKLNVVSHQKDLGIVVDHRLKFHQHTASVASKANRVLGIICKSFECLDVDSLPRLYKALVRPIIEYANSICGPYYIGDQRMLSQKCIMWEFSYTNDESLYSSQGTHHGNKNPHRYQHMVLAHV